MGTVKSASKKGTSSKQASGKSASKKGGPKKGAAKKGAAKKGAANKSDEKKDLLPTKSTDREFEHDPARQATEANLKKGEAFRKAGLPADYAGTNLHEIDPDRAAKLSTAGAQNANAEELKKQAESQSYR